MKIKLKPISDQVVVIAGATSGIGRLAAIRFAEKGAKVVVSGRSQEALEALESEICSLGGESTAFAADVTNFEQMRTLAERAAAAYGRIDTWVQVAAVSVYATLEETRPEEFKQVIDTNLNGQAYGAMAALPYLRSSGGGAFISISSVEARRSIPWHSAYAASKHGVLGMLEALRLELKYEETPVSVTNILPSSINTPFYDKSLTRLGVRPKGIPPIYEPEVVVDAILYAAEHPVREIVVGGAGKSLGLAERLSPSLADSAMMKLGFQGQRSHMPKSEQAPNNLFQHIEGYDQVEGSYSDLAKGTSVYTWTQTKPALKIGLGLAALAGSLVIGRSILQSSTKRKGKR
jgi:NAD(P)-dependent dehydrogenase (short-subunit alcohol dehydrogenase family)